MSHNLALPNFTRSPGAENGVVSRPRYCLAAIVSLVVLAGCGPAAPDEYAVTGVVKYDGKVVPTGVVIFMPTGPGRRVNGPIGGDGHYELHAPAGSYKVAVVAPREVAAQVVTKENWPEAFHGASTSHVPRDVSDPETSPLKYTVVAGPENQYDIEIRK